MQMNRMQQLIAWVFLTGKGLWHRLTVGARVMVVDGDRILLIRHKHVPGWQFPGGGVSPGETLERAGARETLEETGYRVLGAMELFGIYHNTSPVTNRDHVAFYVAKGFEKAFERLPDHEINSKVGIWGCHGTCDFYRMTIRSGGTLPWSGAPPEAQG